jgi:ferredoxin
MLSAGIGITPMIAMLNGLLVNGSRTRHKHPIWFIHGARNRDEHAFAAHVDELAAGHNNLRVHTRYSGRDGHIDMAMMKDLLPFDDYDFYVCGPAGFMQSMYDGLRKLNVADARVRFEAFGPASVRRNAAPSTAASGAGAQVQSQAAAAPVTVRFERSGIDATWDGSHGSLLELAEASGVEAPSGCRSGLCGSCAVGLQGGDVSYTRACGTQPASGQVLLCSTAPRAGTGPLILAL